MNEKNRYSDEELEEFKILILQKLEKARNEYEKLRAEVMNTDGNGTADTSPTFKVLEEGASTLSKRRGCKTGPASGPVHQAPSGCFGANREQDLRH